MSEIPAIEAKLEFFNSFPRSEQDSIKAMEDALQQYLPESYAKIVSETEVKFYIRKASA